MSAVWQVGPLPFLAELRSEHVQLGGYRLGNLMGYALAEAVTALPRDLITFNVSSNGLEPGPGAALLEALVLACLHVWKSTP